MRCSSSFLHSLGLISQVLFYRRSKIQSLKKMLSQPSATKLISCLSSKKAIIAKVIDFILHVVFNRPKREKPYGESRYSVLFATKRKKKKIRQDHKIELISSIKLLSKVIAFL